MPIIITTNNTFKIKFYLITKDERKFKEIPMETVPETHPKIQSLIGKKYIPESDVKEQEKGLKRLDIEINNLEQLEMKVKLEYDESARLVKITAKPIKKPPLIYRDIFLNYDYKIEFRLHRSYPLTKPAVFLTRKNRCFAITKRSKILCNWSPAFYLSDIIHFDFPIYPIKPFRRNHGSPDF